MIQQINNLGESIETKWRTEVTSKIHLIIEPNAVGSGGLYIGGLEGAGDTKLLYKYNITGILTVAALCPISYHNVDRVMFHHVIPVHMDSDLLKYFDQSFDFIEQALEFGNTFIHCISGTERAPAFAMAYVMKKYQFKAETAQEYIKDKCPYSQPNSTFMKQLLQYEQTIKQYKNTSYTIRDNHHISQFTHLSIQPNKIDKWAHSSKEMDNPQMNIIDTRQKILKQEQWLNNFRSPD